MEHETFSAIRRKLDILMSKLIQLRDPQTAQNIIRPTASACKLIYLLRTMPPHQTHAESKRFDSQQRSICETLHRQLTSEAWEDCYHSADVSYGNVACQATLPFGRWGMGLTPTTKLTKSAPISSVLQSRGLLLYHGANLALFE